jgi:transcriptional regulator with XRE-family HTH domain
MKFLEGLMGGPLTLGDTIQAVRMCDEVSQVDLAKRVGLSRQYLCDIEKGRRPVSPDLAVRLARALGYPQALFVRLALQDQLNAAGVHMTVTVEPTKRSRAA